MSKTIKILIKPYKTRLVDAKSHELTKPSKAPDETGETDQKEVQLEDNFCCLINALNTKINEHLDGETLHFILCTSLLETEQLAFRMNRGGLNDYVIFSAKSEKCKRLNDLRTVITFENKSKIVVCTNEARLKNIMQLLNDFNRAKKKNSKRVCTNWKYYFWIDANANMTLLEPYIFNWNQDVNVKQIYLFTNIYD